MCLCLFGIFILTQVSFVCRSNSLSYLWQADQLLKHKVVPSTEVCVAERLHALGRHRMLFEEAEEELRLCFHGCNQCFVAPLPHKQKQLWIGLICWTRVFLRTSAPPILLIVHILMFKTLWSCSILDTASASRSLNYENEEKQHCFHQTAMLFSFYQLVLFPGFQMLKKKKKLLSFDYTWGPGSQLVRKGFAVTAFKVKHI